MARRARTRSEERMEPGPAGDALGRLADILERMWTAPGPMQREPFKAPQYNGHGDVEYFIQHYQEVALANQWGPGATLLHLRRALVDGATDCGKPATETGIYNALRSRYGLSPREARARLSTLRKDHKTSLQEHASEVERLTNLAYTDLPAVHRASMTLETFAHTLGNAYLQRHLLAVQANTLEEAVRAGNEFLRIRHTPSDRGGYSGTTVRMVQDEEEDLTARVTEDPLQTILKKLTDVVETLKTGTRRTPGPRDSEHQGKPSCWGCGKEGHVKRNCPDSPWNQRRQPASGNGVGPQ